MVKLAIRCFFFFLDKAEAEEIKSGGDMTMS